MRFFLLFLMALFLVGCSSGVEGDLYSTKFDRVVLENGDSYDLVVDEVRMDVAGNSVEMMAYNGTIPGPMIVVEQGSRINVNFKNNLEVDSSLHSHGLRLRNEFDGVPGVTQDEVGPGEEFEYELDFPDAGVFFYHPHTREDYQQDSGLYGAFVVLPDLENSEFGVDLDMNHQVVFLDDLQMNGNWVMRNKDKVEQTLMGRYGNRMFIDGSLDGVVDLGKVQVGEERLVTFVNAANVRPFNLVAEGGRMILVADDASSYMKDEVVEELVIAPSERYTVKIEFEDEGEFKIHSTKGNSDYLILEANVLGQEYEGDGVEFVGLDISDDLISQFVDMPVDKVLKLDMDMSGHGGMMSMPCHQMPDGSWMGDCESSEQEHVEGIEWEDGMPGMNMFSDVDNVSWYLVDGKTGKKNMDIDWVFEKGDVIKIRIENLEDSMHPMQHPIHLHGQRFLVLEKDGVVQDNLAWNDTVLVPSGKTYDIIVEMDNLGDWVAHCHIPEHMEAGMMMKFEVI